MSISLDLLQPAAWTVGSALGASGVAVVSVEAARRRRLRSSQLVQRWLTWVVLSSLWMAGFVHPMFLASLITALALIAGKEFALLRDMTRTDHAVLAAVTAGGLVLVVSEVLSPLSAIVAALLLVSLPAVVSQDTDRGPRRMGDLAMGVTVLLVPMVAIWELAAIDGGVTLLITLVAVAFSDVAAFVLGSTFGKRAMAPRLSPNKTWAGVVGNFAGAAAGAGLVAWVMGVSLSVAWPLFLLIAAGAVWGDLNESLLKRHRGVKDAGVLLPGFGGLLDRLDSLLVAAPLVLVAVHVLPGAGA